MSPTAGERIAVLETKMEHMEGEFKKLAKEIRDALKTLGYRNRAKTIAIRVQQVALVGSLVSLTLKVLEVF
jgi:hypothetical protein